MKSIIYEPKGRAREYGELACNLYTGCPHRCLYCYVPNVLHVDHEEFHERCEPRFSIEEFHRDVHRLIADNKGRTVSDIPPIHLCFTCDPYPLGCSSGFTRQVLQVLAEHGLRADVLTKNGIDPRRDFDLLRETGSTLGVTLAAGWFENGASPDRDRIELITQAHERGIRTRVSFEPVIDTVRTMKLIRTVRYVTDLIQVGKLNPRPGMDARIQQAHDRIDWPKFRDDVTALLDRLGGDYYIKTDLREAR